MKGIELVYIKVISLLLEKTSIPQRAILEKKGESTIRKKKT
jgi:hypothetical protein